MISIQEKIKFAIIWCLADNHLRENKYNLGSPQELRSLLTAKQEFSDLWSQVKKLEDLVNKFPENKQQLTEIIQDNPLLWSEKIGLVYGGATKIKQYVFDAAKLPDIRGASAILDKINLVDIPSFFGEIPGDQYSQAAKAWLDKEYSQLSKALIPELLIYYKGGNILTFCPASLVDDLADAIEKRYTQETITANSCAVGATFRPIELVFGLLKDSVAETFWLEDYLGNLNNNLVSAYFEQEEIKDYKEKFKACKNFNEVVTQLTILFNQRRNGNNYNSRSSRRYPTMLETHPYLMTDESDRALAATQAKLPQEPYLSETLARKKLVGQITKRDSASINWYQKTGFEWQPDRSNLTSWVKRFEEFLEKNPHYSQLYYENQKSIKEAQTLIEIGEQSRGYVAYIYADGNNMGGYIQQKIKTPAQYQQFSEDIFEATSQSVYMAIAQHLHPYQLKNLPPDKDISNKNGDWIHPFEIITIGGDDVLIVVPGAKGLAIAQTIGIEFENILLTKDGRYSFPNPNPESARCQRYQPETAPVSQCILSTSSGVLITSYNTPIYYAQKLYNQLLKSAKQKAKSLKKTHHYYSGTIDFLSLKSVTMISSNIEGFRQEGLTIKPIYSQTPLKLYAAPYTLHEIAGLIKTAQALRASLFPKSQIYQIRSLLARGRKTAILNYRYYTVRLPESKQQIINQEFAEGWCQAKTNEGNIAPWMYHEDQENSENYYETIWRDLVDIYDFVDAKELETSQTL